MDALRADAPLLAVILLAFCAFYLERIARKIEAVRYMLEYENKQKYPHMWS
jgi:phage terminase Nu1 subunit (DNA packaging protein)